MSPDVLKAVIGIALVAGFIVIIVVAVMADKNANKKFLKKIEETYTLKDRQGNLVITTTNEVMLYLPSGTLAGYKQWHLEDIAYVGMSTVPATSCSYCFADSNKKPMKGEYLTPSKKPLIQKGSMAFPARSRAELDEVYNFIKKHKPEVKKMVNGTIEE